MLFSLICTGMIFYMVLASFDGSDNEKLNTAESMVSKGNLFMGFVGGGLFCYSCYKLWTDYFSLLDGDRSTKSQNLK